MIGTTLSFIAENLSKEICQRLKINPPENKVQLSSIVDANGSIVVKDDNVLLLKLINIEHETILTGAPSALRMPTGSNLRVEEAPPLRINLSVILASYSRSHQIKTGMDMLSLGTSYLHINDLWSHQNTPDLPQGINQLSFELDNLDFQQLNDVWGAIGTAYLPSVMYKIRVLANNESIQEDIPTISEVE